MVARSPQKTAIVTGAARGVGAAAVVRLAADGWNVLALDRDEAALAELPRDAGIRPHCIDLQVASGIAAFCEGLAADHVTIDGLVNNAAMQGGAPIVEQSLADWQTFLDVNLTAPWLLTKHLAPLFANGASIVNVGSVASITGFADRAAYCATKHGLAGLTKALAAELAPHGIRANLLVLGTIETPGLLALAGDRKDQFAARQLMNRLGSPQEAADAIAFLLGAQSAFMTGSVMTVDGGLLVKNATA